MYKKIYDSWKTNQFQTKRSNISSSQVLFIGLELTFFFFDYRHWIPFVFLQITTPLRWTLTDRKETKRSFSTNKKEHPTGQDEKHIEVALHSAQTLSNWNFLWFVFVFGGPIQVKGRDLNWKLSSSQVSNQQEQTNKPLGPIVCSSKKVKIEYFARFAVARVDVSQKLQSKEPKIAPEQVWISIIWKTLVHKLYENSTKSASDSALTIFQLQAINSDHYYCQFQLELHDWLS